jgi:uncharacterized protein (TIGR03067 family)
MAPSFRLLATCSLVIVAAAWGAARADDMDRLQGTWKVTYAAVGDKVATPQQLKGMRVVIDGNKLTLDEGRGKAEAVHFSLDSDNKPPHIDFRQGKRKEDKLLYHGIYKFADGQLTLCWGPAGDPRPGRFKTDSKNDRRLFVLEKR